jgi:thioredoxin reductase
MIDVIIIGGSFGGLSAAMQLARARRSVLIIDDGKPRNRFSNASHGFLGQDGKNYATILSEGIRQICKYPTVEYVKNRVQTVCKTDKGFIVTSTGDSQELCSRIVIATGLKDKLPLIPGVNERWGKTVLNCPYCHGYEVVGQPIGILATHSMSAQQAILVSDWAPSIFFTQGFINPDPEQEKIFNERQIKIERTPIVEIVGTPPEIDFVKLDDGRKLNISALFITPEIDMANSLAEQLGCDFVTEPLGRFLKVDDWKQTSVKGVFAAGDVVQQMPSATLASATGVVAGVGVHHSLIFAT